MEKDPDLEVSDEQQSGSLQEEEEKPEKNVRTLTGRLFLITLISAIGSSTQYGYNDFLITYPAKHLKSFYNATYRHRNVISIDESLLMFQWGLTIFFYPLGGICGSLLAGMLVDSFGRKRILLANSMLDIIAAALGLTSKPIHSHEFLTCSRLLFGICAGISYSVLPMYLAEIAPQKLRGAICTVPQFFIHLGSLLAHVIGYEEVLGNEEGWPILLSLGAVPAVIQLYLLPFFPESPRYLFIQRKEEAEARKAFRELRWVKDVEYEIEELCQEDLWEKAEKNMDVSRMFWFPPLRWHLLSIVVLMCGQQLSGIYMAQVYANRIYLSTRIREKALWEIRFVIYLFLMSIAVLVIFCIEFLGRKILLLTGLSLCSISCIFLIMSLELQKNVNTMSFLSASFLTIILIGYTIGPEPISNVLVAELFLQSSRSTAFVISGAIHWLWKLLFNVIYYSTEMELAVYSFLLCWPFSIATIVYVNKIIPETKGKSFLEIRQLMDAKLAKQPYLLS